MYKMLLRFNADELRHGIAAIGEAIRLAGDGSDGPPPVGPLRIESESLAVETDGLRNVVRLPRGGGLGGEVGEV